MIFAEDICAALKGRRNSPDRYTARCPAHDDRSPSLSIRQSGDKILVHCHAGCTQDEVIGALRGRGLWPECRDWQRDSRRAWEETIKPTPWRHTLEFLDDALAMAEIVSGVAPYVVIGEQLEQAQNVSYHVCARVAHVLRARSDVIAAHVDRWMSERFEYALHEPLR